MSILRKISRRQFMRLAGVTATGALLAACSPSATPKPAPPPAPTATGSPTVIRPRQVTIELNGGQASSSSMPLLTNPLFTDFAKQTGIEIQFVTRPGYKDDELARLSAAVRAGTGPYDIVDFEDELTTSFSRAGYMFPLNDLLPADFWDDFPPAMKAYSDVWSTYHERLCGRQGSFYAAVAHFL
jgi:ABC-type glycerol-3-phosphate transport system substrate-binding protein